MRAWAAPIALMVLLYGCTDNPTLVRSRSRPDFSDGGPQLVSIASNFNGTSIGTGSTIWFNAIVKVQGLPANGATIAITNGSIQFAAGGTNYTLTVPSNTITFSASATQATTTFDNTSQSWQTTVPMSYSGNVFLSGLSYQTPVTLPSGINPVTWSTAFTSATSGLSVQWKWAAAVYSQFATGNAIGVKAIDGDKMNGYANSDHAGTPENEKPFVTGGARGGGGSDWTGGYSGTGSAVVQQQVSCVCWKTEAPMPTARYYLGVGAANGNLYAVGGQNRVAYLQTVEAYDPSTGTWTTKSPMPTARSAIGVGVVNGVLFAVGGANGGVLHQLEAYDPSTDTWSVKAPMPTARYDLAVGVVNGILYAVGGFDGGSWPHATEAYDPSTDTWSEKSPMPTPRQGLGVGVINGILYAVGGYYGPSGYIATVEAYNPATDTWTELPPMPTVRGELTAGVVNNVLYAAGGVGAAPAMSTLEAYDPATNAWTSLSPMPTARGYLGGGALSGVVYTLGGIDAIGNVTANNEAYQP